MPLVSSFPPVAANDARVLILGSMPGVRSLEAGQYYAHRQNAFWRIMAELLGFAEDADYALRKHMLRTRGVALWDVLASCYRDGSMDADIRTADLVANDFATFLQSHKAISAVFFNGAKAEQVWRRHVELTLPAHLLPARRTRLPSTSPAYAAMSFDDKLAAWRDIIRVLAA